MSQAKSKISQNDLNTLKRIRGEYSNSPLGKWANYFFVVVCIGLFPTVFIGYLFLEGTPSWPLDSEQWLLIGMAIATVGMGVVLFRMVNSVFVFSEEGIEEKSEWGRLKRAVKYEDLIGLEYSRSRGMKFLELKTAKFTMNLEVYKSVKAAFDESGE